MNKIRVENYRSISDSGFIELRPITIAIGRNSAGKSSFMRVFPLLKQTLEKKLSDPILWYGDYVDLGDYQHAVSKLNKEEPVKITFEIDIEESRYARLKMEYERKKLPIDVILSIRERYFDSIIILFEDQKIEINIDEKHRATIAINDDNTIFENKKILALNDMRDIIPTIYENTKNRDRYIWSGIDFNDIVSKCDKYIYSKIKKNEKRWMSLYEYLGIEIGSRNSILEQFRKINKEKFEKTTIKHKRFMRYNNYIIAINLPDIVNRINQAVRIDMEQTSYVKPIRAMVNRYYRVQGISIDKLDADGSNIPMILKNMSSSQLREFEEWCKDKFGIVFSVLKTEGHISLIIKNNINDNEITNVADTGYGYSQMLPIVMLLWMIHKERKRSIEYENKTVVIEQPELHLHPAYQAKMMDVFVNIIKEAKSKGIELKILFETHSETMINRLGTLVALHEISKEDVNILFFDKKDDETIISNAGFSNEGILSGWPIDFFAPEDIR